MVQKRDVISLCRICQGVFYRTQGSASDLQAANARLGQKAYFCQARKITKSLTSSIDVAKFLVSREAKGQVNFLVFFCRHCRVKHLCQNNCKSNYSNLSRSQLKILVCLQTVKTLLASCCSTITGPSSTTSKKQRYKRHQLKHDLSL